MRRRRHDHRRPRHDDRRRRRPTPRPCRSSRAASTEDARVSVTQLDHPRLRPRRLRGSAPTGTPDGDAFLDHRLLRLHRWDAPSRPGEGAIDARPREHRRRPVFVGADDFHLGADSPVDRRRATPPRAGLTEDFDEAPRPNDGDQRPHRPSPTWAPSSSRPPPAGTPPPGHPPPGGGPHDAAPRHRRIRSCRPPPATFGTQTLVTLTGLGLDRRGRVRIRVRNRNTVRDHRRARRATRSARSRAPPCGWGARRSRSRRGRGGRSR